MNLNFRAVILTLLIWAFFGLGDWAQLAAQTNAAAPAHPLANERFLLVIETSSATEKRAGNIQKVAGAIIASGLTGHMLPGTTLGVWTFNDQLSTGKFPLRAWTPESRQHTAREVAQFLQQQEFKKSPRLTGVQAALTNLLAQSERITVIYITSGSQPIKGTPQDELIAETFRSNAEKQRGLLMPFVTILRATKGQVVAAAVTTPPWSLEVPEYPDVPKPDPEALKPPTPDPPPPQPVAPRTSPNVLSPTNVIYLAETSAPPAIKPPVPEVRAEVPTNVAVNVAAPAVTPPPTNQPPEPAVAPIVTPVTNPPVVVAVEVEPPATPPARFSMMTVLAGGIGLLLILLVILIFLLRRPPAPRQKISLITDSLNRRKP
jgi:hypothetical protein